MSMPQHLVVAVISDRYPGGGELAASATAVLRGARGDSTIQPTLVATSTFCGCRLALSRTGIARGILIAEPVWTPLLNARCIDLWLALDDQGQAMARRLIQENGPASGGFYRTVFPDPVVPCGFSVPDPPRAEKFDAWLDVLAKLLAPWRKRIWDAFSDSS